MNAKKNRKNAYNRKIKNSIIKFAVAVITVIAIVTIVVLSTGTAQAKEELCLHKYYKTVSISAGDTIWSIANDNLEGYESAEEYISEVKQINNLGESDNITAGMNLIVPYMSE